MNAIENDVRILVIGYGNPLRGDDGVGWVAAHQLSERVDPEHVGAMAVHQLTPELSENLGRVDRVIFIDAAADRLPGYFSSYVVEPVEPHRSITHQLSPQGLLALTHRRFGKCPMAHLLTVGGRDFGHHDCLSPVVERACERLVAHLEDIIKTEFAHTAVLSADEVKTPIRAPAWDNLASTFRSARSA